jgi:SAM-dependent methyltransferase
VVAESLARVSFEVAADSYDRFMGRYSSRLAPALADLGGVRSGQTAIDVGCGPGALTGELVQRLGAGAVAAVDPSEPFVDAARARHPGVDVRLSTAEELPYADGTFDAALAQLVVHFMSDPVRGLTEMARVTRADGVVAACVWDLEGDRAPLSPFWQGVRELDPDVDDESGRAGTRAGQLVDLFSRAGLRDVEETEISSSVDHASFDEWWEPFTLGVGPAGAYAKTLSEEQLSALRDRCRKLLPEGPFTLTTFAWAARGRAT